MLYAYNNKLIIFRSPFAQSLHETVFQNRLITKKTVTLWYWHHERWNKEETDIIWDQDSAKTLHHLIIAWFALLDEENITPQKVSVQSVALTVSGTEALLSLDQSPFNQERSILQKLQLIEGLLKTIRTTGLKLQSIYLLVHHKPLEDVHMDFSKPWPISGYLQI